MSPRAPLELWFEFASTYSYIAIEAAATLPVTVRYRPFLLGPIFAAQGMRDSPFNMYPIKGQYMMREAILEQARLASVKQALKAQTARAAELQLFGAPTWVVGSELFWGSDRMPQAVTWWKQYAEAAP
jgi:2-hydroxychromene-2-carboxylate isomerase